LVARLGCVLAALITLAAAALELIPAASGLALVVVMPAVLVDVQQHRLPDVWIGGALIVLLAAVGVGWSLGSTPTIAAGLAAGAVVMAAPLLILHLASPASMGFGDVKLALLVGAAVGALDWQLTIPAMAIAAGSTATVGLMTRARTIAFGPGLVAGALIALLAGEHFLTTVAS
jgi:leader peptidase (prepilin peptidase)/N-methyltransferase